MNFDVNKIINESLHDLNEQQIESTPAEATIGKFIHGAKEGVKSWFGMGEKQQEETPEQQLGTVMGGLKGRQAVRKMWEEWERAKRARDYDPNIGAQTYLRRAINRAGQAFGIKKSEWDKEAAQAGVQTHLKYAGKRILQGLQAGESEYITPAIVAGSAIAAGLGAITLRKLLKRKQQEKRA